jgi:hypothetical protein
LTDRAIPTPGLFRGQQPLGLSDAPGKLLFVLLQNHSGPVTAKTLLKELWHPGANPSNVAKQVKTLRVAMGDACSERYIGTLNKEGYAFVMPVTDFPPTGSESMTAVSGGTGALGAAEWHLATEKLIKDFRGSCLHDLELLEEAMAECDSRIRLLASRKGLRLYSRFPQRLMLVPRHSAAGAAWTKPDDVDTEIASSPPISLHTPRPHLSLSTSDPVPSRASLGLAEPSPALWAGRPQRLRGAERASTNPAPRSG